MFLIHVIRSSSQSASPLKPFIYQLKLLFTYIFITKQFFPFYYVIYLVIFNTWWVVGEWYPHGNICMHAYPHNVWCLCDINVLDFTNNWNYFKATSIHFEEWVISGRGRNLITGKFTPRRQRQTEKVVDFNTYVRLLYQV